MDFLFLIEKSLRVAAAALLLYFLLIILPKIKNSSSTKVLAVFAVSLIAYLFTPFAVMYYPKFGILIVLPFLIGAWSCGFLIWMMALRFFDDDFKLGPVHWLCLLVTELASFSIAFSYPPEYFHWLAGTSMYASLILTYAFPQFFTLMYVLLAIRETIKGRQADLIEKRRVFRGKFILVCSAIAVIVITTEISKKIFGLEVISDLFTTSCMIALTFWMAKTTSSDTIWDLPVVKTSTDKNELEKKNELEFSQKFNSHLQTKFFIDPEMNLLKLSDQMGVPEYKLRNYINQTLDFKNFNDFLNQHRVKEACLILDEASAKDISIYNLALDVGFGSPVSFNRAFKKFQNITPTEYKNKKSLLIKS